MRIVISSGHGKFVSGAVGILNEVTEARKVVYKVSEYLKSLGETVVTFNDDVSRKQTDNLNAIVKFHNAQTRDVDISVHLNAAGKTDAPRGVEVLYCSDGALAAKIAAAIAGCSGLKNRGAKKRTDLAFLNKTEKPAALIEVCFVDSVADVKLYNAAFDKICRAITETISGKRLGANAPAAQAPAQQKPAADSGGNEAAIWNFFKQNGLNDFAIAGLMGNLFAESALNPKNLQNNFQAKLGYTDEEYTAAVDSGRYSNFIRDSAGYGLAQWTFWSRKESLLQFARLGGRSVGDLQTQLQFLWRELKGYTSVITALMGAQSVRQVSDVVLLDFERPADQSEAVKVKRAGYGQVYYTKYTGKAAAPVSPTKTFPYTVRVTDSALNVRKGPGTNYAVVGCIKDKGVYTITGEASGPGASMWLKLKSGAGYISRDFIKKL